MTAYAPKVFLLPSSAYLIIPVLIRILFVVATHRILALLQRKRQRRGKIGTAAFLLNLWWWSRTT